MPAVAVSPVETPPSSKVTLEFGNAVPLITKSVALVMLSVCEAPVSEAAARSTDVGAISGQALIFDLDLVLVVAIIFEPYLTRRTDVDGRTA